MAIRKYLPLHKIKQYPDGTYRMNDRLVDIAIFWPELQIFWLCLWGRRDDEIRYHINEMLSFFGYNGKVTKIATQPTLTFVCGPTFFFKNTEELYVDLRLYDKTKGWVKPS